MRNRFGASCYRCGLYCEANEGFFEAIAITKEPSTRKWRVQHAACALKYHGTDHQHDKPETWNRQLQLDV